MGPWWEGQWDGEAEEGGGERSRPAGSEDADDHSEPDEEQGRVGSGSGTGSRAQGKGSKWQVREHLGCLRLEVEPAEGDIDELGETVNCYTDGGQRGFVQDTMASYGVWVPRYDLGWGEDGATVTWAAEGGLVPGPWRCQTSSRAESFGLLSFMRLARRAWSTDRGAVRMRRTWVANLDNEGVVKRFCTCPETWSVTQWMHIIDRDIWEAIANERQRWIQSGEVIEARWVRSHALRRMKAWDMKATDVGNHVADRIANAAERAASTAQRDEARDRVVVDRRHRWRVSMHGEEVTGKVRKEITDRVRLDILCEYMRARDEEAGLKKEARGVDVEVVKRMMGGGRRLTWSVAEIKIFFGLWSTGERTVKHERIEPTDERYAEVMRCPLCSEGEDTHAHVVGECTHAGMVECRRKWSTEVTN